jgi:hypothetical protein
VNVQRLVLLPRAVTTGQQVRCALASIATVILGCSPHDQPRATVTAPPPPADTLGVSINPGQYSASVGDTIRATAWLVVGHDSIKGSGARWVAMDPAIIEVDPTGLVSALAPGVGRIEASIGSHQATGSITVSSRAISTVAAENQLTGTSAWNTPQNRWADPNNLAMWASPYSVGPTDTLDVFVHSTKGAITLDLYRLGWYSGQGGRLVWEARSVPASPQPSCGAPDATGPVTCPWSRTTRIPIDSTWVNGLYFLKATTADGNSAHYPFVLHTTRRATFLAVIPQFTWQAYNTWGGVSLYTVNGHHASFERPYDTNAGSEYILADIYSYDLSAVRWLEHNNVDVGYESDIDVQSGQGGPAPLKALIYIGHSEYWTWAEYDRVQELRDSHKHLAFLAGNNAYWNVRLGTGPITGRAGHVVTCFKKDPDTGATGVHDLTVQFRDPRLNRPENALYGIMYSEGTDGTFPLVVANPPTGSEAATFLAAAGLHQADSIPNGVRSEGDQPWANGAGPANLQILTRSPFIPRDSTTPYEHAYYTTFFIAPSGAGVFAAGNNQFGRGLESAVSQPQPRLTLLLKAVLDWMVGN